MTKTKITQNLSSLRNIRGYHFKAEQEITEFLDTETDESDVETDDERRRYNRI